jgi:hypothetical protein
MFQSFPSVPKTLPKSSPKVPSPTTAATVHSPEDISRLRREIQELKDTNAQLVRDVDDAQSRAQQRWRERREALNDARRLENALRAQQFNHEDAVLKLHRSLGSCQTMFAELKQEKETGAWAGTDPAQLLVHQTRTYELEALVQGHQNRIAALETEKAKAKAESDEITRRTATIVTRLKAELESASNTKVTDDVDEAQFTARVNEERIRIQREADAEVDKRVQEQAKRAKAQFTTQLQDKVTQVVQQKSKAMRTQIQQLQDQVKGTANLAEQLGQAKAEIDWWKQKFQPSTQPQVFQHGLDQSAPSLSRMKQPTPILEEASMTTMTPNKRRKTQFDGYIQPKPTSSSIANTSRHFVHPTPESQRGQFAFAPNNPLPLSPLPPSVYGQQFGPPGPPAYPTQAWVQPQPAMLGGGHKRKVSEEMTSSPPQDQRAQVPAPASRGQATAAQHAQLVALIKERAARGEGTTQQQAADLMQQITLGQLDRGGAQ